MHLLVHNNAFLHDFASKIIFTHFSIVFLNFKEPRNGLLAWRSGTKTLCDIGTGPPGYIGWRNRFLGIDSWTPCTFNIWARLSLAPILIFIALHFLRVLSTSFLSTFLWFLSTRSSSFRFSFPAGCYLRLSKGS
jgi:hypothetical protein